MPVSVIISNFNGERFIPRLIETLQAQSQVEHEIIVVDRLSSDRSIEFLKGFPSVRVISEPPATGLVSGYQKGVSAARFEHLFFCNEDMWFEPECLARLETALQSDPRVWAADPWQWTYDGTAWIHGGMEFTATRFDINSPHPFRGANYTVMLEAGSFVPVGCAGAILVKRERFDELGGWDTSFFLDNEDTDLFLRAWQRGWKCVTVPDAKVYHAVGMSNTKTLGAKQRVSDRRYVSARSNKAVICLKYFSPGFLWMAPFLWTVMCANNLCKMRLRLAKNDFLAAALTLRRLPTVVRFRRQNALWNRRRPGEQFFKTVAVRPHERASSLVHGAET